ncbi:TylF/MycF family methyltransferase [Limnoglobus roseus]|uniref:Macrocin O-methyltransferase n=1 Tax=Limnoglobus roseus TaxID=2598579 RepID=A0A5C1ALG8_9BACT|nr:TylF/MycF family methyltransferase [Limnoglobus roseus]QEL19415.1 macrocin O-methyltransferase [Limnoglobus roseus]
MPDTTSPAADLYFDLLKRSLAGLIHPPELRAVSPTVLASPMVEKELASGGYELCQRITPPDFSKRDEGRDWPAGAAETMIGMKRLNNLQMCVESIVRDGIPGDLIECGVWRGGAAIFMRAALAAFGDSTKTVWVADSFQGLPPPSPDLYPADLGDTLHTYSELAIGVEVVRDNFRRYGLLDDRVRFLEGWFKDTLPAAPISQISVLRADGDMYESTIQILETLYPKLSPGGFCIIDDYGAVYACKQATDDYRRKNGITDPVQTIDWTGVYWRRGS